MPGYEQRTECRGQVREFLRQVPVLFQEGHLEKIESLLEAIETNCGRIEYSVRLRQLIAIDRNSFTASDFTLKDYQAVMSYIEDHRFTVLMDSVHESPSSMYRFYFGDPELIFAFDQITINLALRILEKPEIKYLPICDFGKHCFMRIPTT